MPVFSTIAAAATAFGAFITSSTLAAFVARTVLTIGISKLLSNRSRPRGGGESGSRIQLPPATDNKLPVVYGKAYVTPVVTDAKLTENQKIMWYVCALAEGTDSGSYTFGDIYWNGRKCIFGDPYTAKVTALETNSDPVQTDTSVNGWIYIWRFPNGSLSGIDTGGSSAISLLSDAVSGGGIPANIRWNSPLYTSNGQSADMEKTAFLVIRLEYNVDANTTGLPPITVELTNSLTKPGQVLYDYMTNTRYGCAISPSDVDTVSLTSLDTYSDELLAYYDTNNVLQTQPRYRIDGPINTNNTCLDNLEILVDSADSWLQYSELTGKWKVVINQSYQQAGQLISDLYQVTDSNLIGGINVNPIDLNNTFNQLEVQYPNKNIRDQTDFKTIKLIDYYPELLSKNEPINNLTVQLPVVNNYVRGVYLGLRRLLQSREDLIIDFFLDYSGIQLEAGDVIRVPFSTYGWQSMNSGNGKLFRVSQVQEAKLEDGTLGVKIIAFEYNTTIYLDNPIYDFIPSDNTGLTDPNIISQPGKPVAQVNTDTSGAITSFSVTSAVPEEGSVLYMDFNYGLTSNVDTHLRYRTVSSATGLGFTNSGDIANSIVNNITIDINDLPANVYYFSVTGRNDFSGRVSIVSDPFTWAGADISNTIVSLANNANSSGNIITCDIIPNITIGSNVFLLSGTGNLAANTYVTTITSNGNPTIFTVDPTPITPLVNANIQVVGGGINGNSIRANTLPGDCIVIDTITSNLIQSNAITSSKVAANAITTENLQLGTVSQAKYSLIEASVLPYPFTNVSNTWPNNTRGIVPAGGVTLVATTTPDSTANQAYQEGTSGSSRIEVNYTIQLYVDPEGANNYNDYNCVELYKTGQSFVFDTHFYSVRHSYSPANSTSGRTQTIHAYGSGAQDLFSSDGGNTWSTWAGNATDLIINEAINVSTGNVANNLTTLSVGYLQQSGNNQFSAGDRQGNTGSGSALVLDENLNITGTPTKLDLTDIEIAPNSSTNGDTTSTKYELLAVGENGFVAVSLQPQLTPAASDTWYQETVGVPLKNLNGIFANERDNANTYTSIAVGQTGTIIRSDRTFNTSNNTWSSKVTTTLNGQSLLTNLLGVSGDGSIKSSSSKWVAVGQYGMIQVSVNDGNDWTQVESPTLNNLNAIRYGGNTWVVVGDNGIILKNNGNIQLANNWIQIDTSNLTYVNGSSYGNIIDRDLYSIDYSPQYDKFNIGGQNILLTTNSSNIVPQVSYVAGPSETYDLTRLTYFGSWANIANTSRPPVEQRVLNNQVFNYTYIDTNYTQGQEITYYLVVGNMAGKQIYVGQAYLNVQEIKR